MQKLDRPKILATLLSLRISVFLPDQVVLCLTAALVTKHFSTHSKSAS